VRELVDASGVDLAQLHGDEPAGACAECGVPALRVVHVDEKGSDDAAGADDRAATVARFARALARADGEAGAAIAVLLDTAVRGERGGTGAAFDWRVAAALANAGVPALVAGGLSAANVGPAIGAAARPLGVDASSALEVGRGRLHHSR